MITAAFALLAFVGQPEPRTPSSAQPPQQVRKDRPQPDITGATLTFEGELFDGTESTTVATGLIFAEGPLYRADGTFVVCDLSGNAVYTINLEDGRKERKPGDGVDTLRKPSGSAAGSALDKDGRLIFAQFDGKVTRLEKDGKLSVIAEEVDGKKLNSPNDLVLRSDGAIYFTDFRGGDGDHVTHPGVYRITAAGKVELLTKDVEAPNGLAFSPDEKTLYVAMYRKSEIRAFDVSADGALSNPRTFATAKDPAIKGSGTTDGVKVDLQGNVWTTGPGGAWVFGVDGKRIARVIVSTGGLSNIAFGGPDGKTAYFTGGPRVLSARLKAAAVAPAKKSAEKPETPKSK